MVLEIWAEKYRPRMLADVINQKHVTDRMKAFVKDKHIPHLMFAGPAGTGKTTMGLALARELYGTEWKKNVLELNASDERGIDVIRHKVKEFARTKPIGGVQFRIVILDEADALTQDAQQALRRTMESHTGISRFILICNWSTKIIEPIQSRCAVFRFRSLSEDDIKTYIDRVAKSEKLDLDGGAVNAIIEITEGDLRRVSNLMQSAASLGSKISQDSIYDAASRAKPNDVRDMLNQAISGNFSESRKMLQDLLLKQGLAGSDVLSEIHRQIYSFDMPEEKKMVLIDKCGEYDFRISEGGNELIQIEAFLAQVSLLSKK
ncbi:MAG: replication factor C small subunit [Candidatus Aenigmarchaeota archaeon]|nr:replication factor C small subunit [Candidatus Aenigmarchaeota archaeon]